MAEIVLVWIIVLAVPALVRFLKAQAARENSRQNGGSGNRRPPNTGTGKYQQASTQGKTRNFSAPMREKRNSPGFSFKSLRPGEDELQALIRWNSIQERELEKHLMSRD